MAQWWEKVCVAFEKKVIMWKFYDAHKEKSIKQRSEQKICSEESSGQMNDSDDKWKIGSTCEGWIRNLEQRSRRRKNKASGIFTNVNLVLKKGGEVSTSRQTPTMKTMKSGSWNK